MNDRVKHFVCMNVIYSICLGKELREDQHFLVFHGKIKRVNCDFVCVIFQALFSDPCDFWWWGFPSIQSALQKTSDSQRSVGVSS